MIYKAPTIDNKVYWVPIVAKNRDYLMGYIKGCQNVEDIILDSLNNAGMDLKGLHIDLCLDSSRFNDVLENGLRESDLSREEINRYYEKLIKQKFERVTEKHPENEAGILDAYFLTVECPCGLGIYSFQRNEIPDKQFKCAECGRIIIDYTGHDDFEYDFDGKIRND